MFHVETLGQGVTHDTQYIYSTGKYHPWSTAAYPLLIHSTYIAPAHAAQDACPQSTVTPERANPCERPDMDVALVIRSQIP